MAVDNNHDIRYVVQIMQAGADSYLLWDDLNTENLLAAIDEVRQNPSERRTRPISSSNLTLSRSSQASETHAEDRTLAIIQIDDLVIDNQKLNAAFEETPLDLSPTEFAILSCLAHSAGQVVTFEELVFHVYGIRAKRDQARRTLAAHISNLRGKLRAVGGDNYLVNRRGRGYLIEREATTYSLPVHQRVEHYARALNILTARLPDMAMCLYDRNLNVLTASGQILASESKPSLTQKATDFFFATGHASSESQIEAVFGEKTSHFEHEHQGRDYIIDLLPITDTTGHIPMGMILVQDISMIKQLDSLVNGELEELTSKIMTQVTGEMRAILTALQTSTEMLVRYRERISEEERIARLNQIHTHINHLVEHFEAIATLSQTFSNRQR